MQQVYKNNAAGSIKQRSSGDNGLAARPLEQEWHRSGSCPEGTIPIRRMLETTVNPNLTIIPELSVSSHGNIVIEDDSNSPRAEVHILPAPSPFTILSEKDLLSLFE